MLRRLASFPALAVALTAMAAAQSAAQQRGVAATAAAVAGTALVALARRSALLVVAGVAASVGAQALLAAGDPVFGSFVAFMGGFYAVGRIGRPAQVVVAAAFAAAAVAAVLWRDPRPFAAVEVVFPLVYFGAATAAGRLVWARERDAAATLAAARREAEARESAALAAERARIAREMHDVVAHSVSLLVVQAESAAAVLPTDAARAAAQMERVADSGRQALGELRRLLGVLRADEDGVAVGPQPGLADLDELVASVRSTGLDARLAVDAGLDDVPPGLQLTAYRVVQEALTNAVRHGRAREVAVRVQRRGAELHVEVVDDGAAGSAGAAPVAPGHGLVGMRERLRLYGGRLDAGPCSEGGWRVLATAPVVTP